MLGMKVINVCSQISLGLQLSTFTMSFSIRVLPPLNKEQKMTLLLVLHPHHWQVPTHRFLLVFGAVSGTGLTWNKQNISSLLWVFSSGAGAGNQAGFTSSACTVGLKDASGYHPAHQTQSSLVSSWASRKTTGSEYKEKAFAACSHQVVPSPLVY